MGSKTTIIKNITMPPLVNEENHYTYKKQLFLERGKQIVNGGDAMRKMFGQQLVDMKSLYNGRYLERMDLAPVTTIPIKSLDLSQILSHVQTNIDSSAVSVEGSYIGIPTMNDVAKAGLDNAMGGVIPDYNSIIYDGNTYKVATVTYNGPYIDVRLIGTDIPKLAADWVAANYGASTPYTINNTSELSSYAVEFDLSIDIDNDGNYLDTVIQIPMLQHTVQVPNSWYSALNTMKSEVEAEFNGVHTQRQVAAANEALEQTVYEVSYDTKVTVNITGWASATKSIDFLDPQQQFRTDYYHLHNDPDAAVAYGYLPIFRELLEDLRERLHSEVEAAIRSKLATIMNNIVVTYRDVSNDLKIAWFPQSEYAAGVVTEETEVYPIIPLRDKFASAETSMDFTLGDKYMLDDKRLHSALGKIGLNVDDFVGSFDQGEIKRAGLAFGVPMNDTSPEATKYLFEAIFALAGTPNGDRLETNLRFEFGYYGYEVDMTYKISYDNSFSGKEVGDYWHGYGSRNYSYTYWDIGATDDWVKYDKTIATRTKMLHKKISNDTTIVIEILDFGVLTSVGNPTVGYGKFHKDTGVAPYDVKNLFYSGNPRYGPSLFGVDYDGTETDLGDIPKFPIIRDVFNKMTLDEEAVIIVKAMFFIVYTKQVIKTKWYQTGFFKFVVMAAMIWTGNIYGALLNVAAQAGLFDGTFGAVLQLLLMDISSILNIATGAFTITLTSSLALASTLVNIVGVANRLMIEGTLEALQEEMSSLQAVGETLQEEYKEVVGEYIPVWVGLKNHEPDTFYNLACNTDVMCNYDVLYNIDRVIESKSVAGYV